MNIYDYIFIFYAVLAALLFGALCIRWYGRVHIVEKSPARALQSEAYADDLGIEAAVEPRPRFGLLDPDWKYVPSVETDIRKTFREYRAQTLSQGGNRE
jgi:hypothetical protein